VIFVVFIRMQIMKCSHESRLPNGHERAILGLNGHLVCTNIRDMKNRTSQIVRRAKFLAAPYPAPEVFNVFFALAARHEMVFLYRW